MSRNRAKKIERNIESLEAEAKYKNLEMNIFAEVRAILSCTTCGTVGTIASCGIGGAANQMGFARKQYRCTQPSCSQKKRLEEYLKTKEARIQDAAKKYSEDYASILQEYAKAKAKGKGTKTNLMQPKLQFAPAKRPREENAPETPEPKQKQKIHRAEEHSEAAPAPQETAPQEPNQTLMDLLKNLTETIAAIQKDMATRDAKYEELAKEFRAFREITTNKKEVPTTKPAAPDAGKNLETKKTNETNPKTTNANVGPKTYAQASKPTAEQAKNQIKTKKQIVRIRRKRNETVDKILAQPTQPIEFSKIFIQLGNVSEFKKTRTIKEKLALERDIVKRLGIKKYVFINKRIGNHLEIYFPESELTTIMNALEKCDARITEDVDVMNIPDFIQDTDKAFERNVNRIGGMLSNAKLQNLRKKILEDLDSDVQKACLHAEYVIRQNQISRKEGQKRVIDAEEDEAAFMQADDEPQRPNTVTEKETAISAVNDGSKTTQDMMDEDTVSPQSSDEQPRLSLASTRTPPALTDEHRSYL